MKKKLTREELLARREELLAKKKRYEELKAKKEMLSQLRSELSASKSASKVAKEVLEEEPKEEPKPEVEAVPAIVEAPAPVEEKVEEKKEEPAVEEPVPAVEEKGEEKEEKKEETAAEVEEEIDFEKLAESMEAFLRTELEDMAPIVIPEEPAEEVASAEPSEPADTHGGVQDMLRGEEEEEEKERERQRVNSLSPQDLLCVFCFRPLCNAQRLSCGHFCCKACMQIETYQYATVVATSTNVSPDGFKPSVVCPRCASVTEMPLIMESEHASERAKELHTNAKARVCSGEGCDKPAAVHCTICGDLCEDHENFLHGILQGHEVSPLEIEPWMTAIENDVTLCAEHNKEMSVFCQVCNKFICVDCFNSAHRSHIPINFASLEVDVDRFVDVGKELAELHVKDVDFYVSEKVDTVHQIFAKVRETVDGWEQSAIDDIRSFEKNSSTMTAHKKAAMCAVDEDIDDFMSAMEVARTLRDDKLVFALTNQMTGFAARTEPLTDSLTKALALSVMERSDAFVSESFCSVKKVEYVSPLVTRKYIQVNPNFFSAESFITGADALFTDMNGGGVVFDQKKRIRIETSNNKGGGAKVYSMRLNEDGTGTAVKHRNHLPFRTYIGPVYDGERWVYFFESNDPGFCRMDIETLEVERRQRAPHDISSHVYGFFRAGKVYAFSSGKQLMEYDPEANTWTDLHFRAESNNYQERFEVNPWNDEELIHLRESGELEVVNFVTGNVMRTFPRFPGRVNNIPETLVLAAPNNEFFLLVCYGNTDRPWQVFSSATNTWTETSWETTTTYTRSAMFDELTGTLYYHVDHKSMLTAVRIPQTM